MGGGASRQQQPSDYGYSKSETADNTTTEQCKSNDGEREEPSILLQGRNNGEGESFNCLREVHFPNGSTYVGDWLNGEMHGAGKLIHCNGDIYEGEFAHNLMHGQGKTTFARGKQDAWHEGMWLNGQKNGHGVLRSISGGLFIGEFKYDKEEGHGIKTWSNGDSYVGEWARGKLTGNGVYKYADGDIFEGKLDSSGELITGSFTFSNGKKYVGNFEEQSVQSWVSNHSLNGRDGEIQSLG